MFFVFDISRHDFGVFFLKHPEFQALVAVKPFIDYHSSAQTRF